MNTTTPRERPILFSGPMVRALLDGRKTQTRRVAGLHVINAEPDRYRCLGMVSGPGEPHFQTGAQVLVQCRYGQPGDRLWVKENAYIAPKRWADCAADCNAKDADGDPRLVGYAASMDGESTRCAEDYKIKLSPSIFMPRWASRLTLEITGVRVERVQDISEDDAVAEGLEPDPTMPDSHWLTYAGGSSTRTPEYAYETLWDSINAKRGEDAFPGADHREFSWAANPWVWVVEFQRAYELPLPRLPRSVR